MESRPARRWQKALIVAGLTTLTAAAAGACWARRLRRERARRRAKKATSTGVPSLAEEIREALEREAAELASAPPSEELQSDFAAAAAWVAEGGDGLSTNAKLRLYGCYKQVYAGDAPTERARGMEASMKWGAWSELRGVARIEAMRRYIAAVDELAPCWRDDRGSSPRPAHSKADGSSGMGNSVSTMGHLRDPDNDEAHREVDDTPVGQLCEAIALGNSLLAMQMLQRHPDLAFKRDKDGMTALHWAADRGELEVARALLDMVARKSSADGLSCLNARDRSGETPLHYAVNTDNPELARLLVAAGAKPSIANNEGETPMELAQGLDGWEEIFRP